jgi:hypothetical protein
MDCGTGEDMGGGRGRGVAGERIGGEERCFIAGGGLECLGGGGEDRLWESSITTSSR